MTICAMKGIRSEYIKILNGEFVLAIIRGGGTIAVFLFPNRETKHLRRQSLEEGGNSAWMDLSTEEKSGKSNYMSDHCEFHKVSPDVKIKITLLKRVADIHLLSSNVQ